MPCPVPEYCWLSQLVLSLDQDRNCLKYIQSNSVPLPNSCLLNPGRGPKSNRTSRLSFAHVLVLSSGKATNFIRTRGFGKLTRFRNTRNLEKFMNFAHFLKFWCFSLGQQARFTSNFCSGLPPEKVHELAFRWFGLPG